MARAINKRYSLGNHFLGRRICFESRVFTTWYLVSLYFAPENDQEVCTCMNNIVIVIGLALKCTRRESLMRLMLNRAGIEQFRHHMTCTSSIEYSNTVCCVCAEENALWIRWTLWAIANYEKFTIRYLFVVNRDFFLSRFTTKISRIKS